MLILGLTAPTADPRVHQSWRPAAVSPQRAIARSSPCGLRSAAAAGASPNRCWSRTGYCRWPERCWRCRSRTFTAVTARVVHAADQRSLHDFVRAGCARVRAHDRGRDDGRHPDERAAGLVCHAPQLRRRPFAGIERSSGTTGWWGRGLLVSQVSLAIVMLVNASLLTRSLYLAQHRRPRDPPRQPADGQDLVVASRRQCTVERTATATIRRWSRRCARCPAVTAVALAS